MNLLIKFPTKGRRERFVQTIRGYLANIVLPETKILVTFDSDDRASTTPDILKFLEHNKVEYTIGYSKSKVDACNRDLEGKDFDVVLLASDDMICVERGFDKIICDAMEKHFPDTDGSLHFNDGYTQDRLRTMVIFGKKYYDRFGYLYHPDYISLWSDNEDIEVAKLLNKYQYFPQILFKHQHYANDASVKRDERYNFTEQFYLADQKTFDRRKAMNFGLSPLSV